MVVLRRQQRVQALELRQEVALDLVDDRIDRLLADPPGHLGAAFLQVLVQRSGRGLDQPAVQALRVRESPGDVNECAGAVERTGHGKIDERLHQSPWQLRLDRGHGRAVELRVVQLPYP